MKQEQTPGAIQGPDKKSLSVHEKINRRGSLVKEGIPPSQINKYLWSHG